MDVMSLKNTRNSISSLWRAVIGSQDIDRGYDQYERVPVRKSEISEMLALHYRTDDQRGYSKAERIDHDNLAALRDVLYPPSAA